MDQKTLNLQLGRFEALKANIPPFIRQDFVDEYNSLVDALSRATTEDLTSFRILPQEVKHKTVGSRRAAYGRRESGSTVYSADKFCESDLFNRRIQSLDNYLKSEGFVPIQEQREQHSRSAVHIGTMIGSAFQQGTRDSHIAISFDAHSDEFRDFISQLKKAATRLPLAPDTLNELHTDIATVEVQIASANPKKSIIVECGSSIRTIFEQAAGNMIASGLLPLICRYFPK